ncbi:c77203f6-8ef4-4178-8bce-2219d3aaf89a [Thermothielavioides terrestris]|uniref:C77203f6-8ef4-4178-8bce-2219d3aaf89a n=1 Tax=Thermothielavioides terrestris TaxID=2587410 RepID=A0A446BE98_9PEZI|nr:c77203f6-8ef4-4178-8bce-2219d3aaf89a [Thermothielavioides terrestris]
MAIADETSGVESNKAKANPKSRRPHKKSRFGCTRCKARRIKCDELSPRCSRCRKMDLTCLYLRRTDQWRSVTGDSGHSGHSGPSEDGGSPQSCTSPDGSWFDWSAVRAQGARMLEPAEFELLEHYLEHTSSDPTGEPEDQYTLRVGIPTLACQSKPLMLSVLALAAVCKCSDIISQPVVSLEDRQRVQELLSVADGYHLASLREIQATLHEPKRNYDHVLANAGIMGMYGSGSHCMRIWLAKTRPALNDRQLCDYLTPEYAQWIRLFRAVRLAYAGLLTNAHGPPSPDLPPEYRHPSPGRAAHNTHAAVANHPLGPILAATVHSALARLREKAGEIAVAQEEAAGYRSPELQTCFTALAILGNIVAKTFGSGSGGEGRHWDEGDAIDNPAPLAGQLAEVSEISPWLRRYAASISSVVPSRLPRRTIMSFVHKVPGRYLALVEEMLVGLSHPRPPHSQPDQVDPQLDQIDLGAAHGARQSSEREEEERAEDPSIAHQLAVDIFAHWLVLVLLLDNVWWIGGIGAWELGRLVALRRDPRWRACLWNRDRDWWPESMCEVSRLLEKHR